MPSAGRIVFVDVDARRVVDAVYVPRGPGPVAASIDGSCVLVANTRLGVVTQIDGIHARWVRRFVGLGRPVALAIVAQPQVGLVRPRYAVVADARGWIDLLDLATGRVASRMRVARPTAVTLENGRLWVASARSATVTQFDLSIPTHPRLLGRARVAAPTAALTPFETSSAAGVDVISLQGALTQVDGYMLTSKTIRRLPGRFTQLLEGYDSVVWAAASDGRLLGVRTSGKRAPYVMHVPRASQLAIVGGWLAAASAHTLRMFALGTHRRARTIQLPGTTTAIAFAVLP